METSRVQLDKEKREAMYQYIVDHNLTHESFAKKIGATKQAVGFWLSGKRKSVKPQIWNNIVKILGSAVDANYKFSVKIGKPLPGKKITNIFPGPNTELNKTAPINKTSKSSTSINTVPIITMASAAGFEPALEPLDDFMHNNKIGETVFVGEVKEGIVAVKIEGDSMSPRFPHGTIVFVDTTQFPKRGDYVIARLTAEGMVFKEYSRKDNVITLSSINPDGRNFSWNVKEQPGYMMYMWPCLYSTVDLRQQRWEKTKINGK